MEEHPKSDSMDEYQQRAMRTAKHDLPTVVAQAVGALGLAGESGEYADTIKKHIGHGHTLDVDKLVDELGDVLWYVAYCAHYLGVSLSYVAEHNIEKLRARYPDGFSTERSINR